MSEGAGKITLKLLVDKNEKRVIFGEAGKDFVDFLFHFLSLPLGTVVKLVSKEKMVSSLGKVYDSIEAMHSNYMEPNLNKEVILNPKVSSSFVTNTPLLCNNSDDSIGYKSFYKCCYSNHYSHVSSDPNAVCPSCGNYMNSVMTYVSADPGKEEPKVAEGGGYVKGLVTYMIMDNLEVKPMSSISSITLLNTFKVKDLAALDSLDVSIGQNEALELLKTSLLSNKVLTTVFLHNPKAL